MTTEVLRNMLYAGSPDLTGLTHVVMDEIHYLADKFRGAVWEEVILHLAADVQVVGLSATVSNAEEFGAWLAEVRGELTVVVDEIRPVPLWQHMLVGRRLFDLFGGADPARRRPGRRPVADRPGAGPGGARRGGHGRPVRLRRPSRPRRGGPGGGANGGDQGSGGGPRWRPPARVDVIERLDGAGLLPAITFIFSRAGCDAAVAQCVRSGMRLTTEKERDEIRQIVDRRTVDLVEADLGVLGYWEWREALERGIAAHHAGLLPVFKETVEELFVAGLVKAVFATETLALGINMPARTVVLEKLSKYNGEGHADLTAGGVHPADRPGRPARHRHRGPRGGGLVARDGSAGGRRPGVPPHLPAAVVVPAELQHGRQPGRPARPGRRPGSCSSSPSRSTRRTPRWSAWPGRSTRNTEAIAVARQGDAVPSRRHRVLPGAARPTWPPPRRRSPGPARPAGATRRPATWRSCAAATSSRCPPAGGPGWPSSSIRAWPPTGRPGRWWSPRAAGRAG